MTLDEAIIHAKEQAEMQEEQVSEYIREDEPKAVQFCKCAEEHRQLAEWLIELKVHREALKKVKEEIERQQKWLFHAGYTTYNVDIAIDAIKSVVAESEE